jgi:hypothetical protein
LSVWMSQNCIGAMSRRYCSRFFAGGQSRE